MRMLYDVRNEDGRPGVAGIVVPAAAGRARGVIELAILGDDPERPYLGPQGWQPVEYRWRSGQTYDDGSDLVVPVGERVTSQLEDFTTLSIRFPALRMEGVLTWQGVTPPTTSGGPQVGGDPNGGASFFVEPAAPAPKPEPEPEPQPAPQPEPEKAPPIIAQPAERPAFSPEPPQKGGSMGIWVAVAVILALVIAGGVAYQQQLGPFAPPPPVQPPVIAKPADPPPPPQPVTPPAAAPAQAPTPAPAELSPEQRQAAAQTAVAAGRYDDATRQLDALETANYGPALLYRARLMDSVDFAPGLYATPNDIAALELYAAACRAGQAAAARPDLQKLKQLLRERADDGDVVAGEILRTAVPRASMDCG